MGNLMVSLKKFVSNKNTVTILGVLLGIVVLYFGYTWRVNQSTSPVDVPYSVNTMLAQQRITEQDIGIVSVPSELVANWKNIILDSKYLTNAKLVSFDSKIAANSFFFAENIIEESKMPDSVFSNIKDGYTIYALDVNSKKTYSNSIFPGDMIDLYLKTSDEDLLVYGRFIKSIEVIAVKDSQGRNVFEDKDNLKEPAQLLFAVPEDLFLLLKKVENIQGDFDIDPVPRNDSYTKNAAATELVNAELESFVRVRTYILQDECTDLTACG
jgi:hypothetical protein